MSREFHLALGAPRLFADKIVRQRERVFATGADDEEGQCIAIGSRRSILGHAESVQPDCEIEKRISELRTPIPVLGWIASELVHRSSEFPRVFSELLCLSSELGKRSSEFLRVFSELLCHPSELGKRPSEFLRVCSELLCRSSELGKRSSELGRAFPEFLWVRSANNFWGTAGGTRIANPTHRQESDLL